MRCLHISRCPPAGHVAAMRWPISCGATAGKSRRAPACGNPLANCGRASRIWDLPLILDHDKVALDAALVDVDVGALVKLATSDNVKDLRRAARIYSGDLFHGFDIGDPAYADWLRAERERLRATAIGILKRLLEREAGQAAVAAGRRLLELDPMDEDVTALDETLCGRRRDWRRSQAGPKVPKDLRSELAAQPSPETEALHRKIRDRTGAPAAQPERSSDAVRHESAAAAPASKPSIGVLPFANLSGEADQQQLTDGITNDLIADLSRFSSLLVKRARRRNVDVEKQARSLVFNTFSRAACNAIGNICASMPS